MTAMSNNYSRPHNRFSLLTLLLLLLKNLPRVLRLPPPQDQLAVAGEILLWEVMSGQGNERTTMYVFPLSYS